MKENTKDLVRNILCVIWLAIVIGAAIAIVWDEDQKRQEINRLTCKRNPLPSGRGEAYQKIIFIKEGYCTMLLE